MIYGDLIIGSIDQYHLDKLSDIHDIDYYNAEIETEYPITNQLFYYVLTQAVNNLDISEDNKEYLQSKIYINCFDSGFDLSSEDVDDMIDGTDEEKTIIKEFLDL